MNPIEWYFGLWQDSPVIALLLTIFLAIVLFILVIIIAIIFGFFIGLTDWAGNLFRR